MNQRWPTPRRNRRWITRLRESQHYGSAALAERFRERWRKTGKKLDMGKACIRFRHVEDLALDVIGQTIREVPARKYIEQYEATLNGKAKPAKPKASAARRGRRL